MNKSHQQEFNQNNKVQEKKKKWKKKKKKWKKKR